LWRSQAKGAVPLTWQHLAGTTTEIITYACANLFRRIPASFGPFLLKPDLAGSLPSRHDILATNESPRSTSFDIFDRAFPQQLSDDGCFSNQLIDLGYPLMREVRSVLAVVAPSRR